MSETETTTEYAATTSTVVTPERASDDLLATLKAANKRVEMAVIGRDAIVQGMLEHYQITGTDSIDIETGIITRMLAPVISPNGDQP